VSDAHAPAQGHNSDRGQGQRPRRQHRSPADPDTHFSIVTSDSPISVDGYALNEPKELVCDDCGASVLLTPEPSAGIDEFPHKPNCDQRACHWVWWWETFGGD